MAKKVYTLKEKKTSEECHLFECTPVVNGCNCPPESICKKMDVSETIGNNIFDFVSDQRARTLIAELEEGCAELA